MNEIIEPYREKRDEIKSRLKEFESLPKGDYFKEFLFCLLTPQSNAKKCWIAVQQLSIKKPKTEEEIVSILKDKTRFHNTKARRILKAEETFEEIKPLLKEKDKRKLRNLLAEKVNGYGLKESSHFLRNIGHSKNQIAILDRHILRNLKKYNIIEEEKIKGPKHYIEIEDSFLNFSKKLSIPVDHLDLLWWSQENGEIFK